MKEITEGMGEHLKWQKEIDDMTLEELPAFIKKLTTKYHHDYGTICHAIACGAIATAKAIDRSPSGGITGFQAGAVMWEMIKLWGVFGSGPKRMMEYDQMLYPQYEHHFRTITPETWSWLKDEAKKNLAKETASPKVLAHWKTITQGIVPFGFRVEAD
jgi:hypothetical protein